MPDDVERLADQFESAGHIVTRRFEVDVNAAAQFLSASVHTLRNWRSFGVGPSATVRAGRAWYSIAGLLAWRDAKRSRDASVIDIQIDSGAESPPLASRNADEVST